MRTSRLKPTTPIAVMVSGRGSVPLVHVRHRTTIVLVLGKRRRVSQRFNADWGLVLGAGFASCELLETWGSALFVAPLSREGRTFAGPQAQGERA